MTNPGGRPRVVIVGLGPGGDEHITVETRRLCDIIGHRYLRTARHPSAHVAGAAETFDELYERADRFDDVYAEIVERLVAAAHEHGEVLYAVPGSPFVLEKTVELLRTDERIETDIRPAMSFLEVAWARLGIDPVETRVRLIDGHDFAVAAADDTGPLLVAHTHANWVLSDIKLAVEGADADTPVTLLKGLGTDDEQLIETNWADMDRAVEADHLTCLYIPRLAESVAAGYVRFHQLARTLREQCPWDREQTHASLVQHLVEETYEVVDALGRLDPQRPETDEDLIEELGDLLYQIEFHATIAEQEGRFSIADVTDHVHTKLVRRHPHVFGNVDAADSDAVMMNWEQIKQVEKRRTSVFDGVPPALPALAYSYKVQKKAATLGFDWPDVDGALPKIAEEAGELRRAADSGDDDATAEELGDLLFAVVNVARHLKADPESALRRAAQKFRRRFEAVERLATERGVVVAQGTELATLDALWDEVKASE